MSTNTPEGGDGERLVRWSDGPGPVRLSETGGYAYRDGQVIVHEDGLDAARGELGGTEDGRRAGSFGLFHGVDETLLRIEALRARGVHAQPNHVLFSNCGCYCPPHPALGQHWANAIASLGSNPLGSNPLGSNPLGSNPLGSNPLGSNPLGSNPLGSNPWGWAPSSDYAMLVADFQPNPAAVPASLSHPFDGREFRSTGERGHSVHPAVAPIGAYPGARKDERYRPNIVVLDTGLAAGDLRPDALQGVVGLGSDADWTEYPDESNDGRLDPVAGHGTFIAGVVERIAPRCHLKVDGLFTGYGHADEFEVAHKLEDLVRQGEADEEDHVDLLNLSFSGYTLLGMAPLAQAVIKLRRAGTVVVASAGNDGTCMPAYPAAFPGVISVGALGPSGPAWFTNYGPWVRACAPGVDIVSTFFKVWARDDETFAGWARWSGTSFAAPAVVGALAVAMRRHGLTADQAVAEVIDDPSLMRIPGLGTVVNQGQGWRSPP